MEGRQLRGGQALTVSRVGLESGWLGSSWLGGLNWEVELFGTLLLELYTLLSQAVSARLLLTLIIAGFRRTSSHINLATGYPGHKQLCGQQMEEIYVYTVYYYI